MSWPALPEIGESSAGETVLQYAIALFDYDSQQSDELNIEPNDFIVVTRKRKDGWWRGQIFGPDGEGSIGLFPSNYIKDASLKDYEKLQSKYGRSMIRKKERELRHERRDSKKKEKKKPKKAKGKKKKDDLKIPSINVEQGDKRKSSRKGRSKSPRKHRSKSQRKQSSKSPSKQRSKSPRPVDKNGIPIVQQAASVRKGHPGRILEGWVMKRKKKSGISTWKPRFLVLTRRKLGYFECKLDKKPLGFFDVTELVVKDFPDHERPYTFGLRTDDSEYEISAKNEAWKKAWLDAIEDVRETRQRTISLLNKSGPPLVRGGRYRKGSSHSKSRSPGITYESEEDVIFASFIQKRKDKKGPVVSRWKNRYMRLTPLALYYFEEEDDARPIGQLDLIETRVKRGGKATSFELSCERGAWEISVENEAIKDSWIEAIENGTKKLKAIISGEECGIKKEDTEKTIDRSSEASENTSSLPSLSSSEWSNSSEEPGSSEGSDL